MKKKNLIFLIAICFVTAIFLCGCQTKKIEFYRESNVQKMYKDIGIIKTQPKKDTITKSGGVYIYKINDNEKNKNIKLGPKDLDFDIKVKF